MTTSPHTHRSGSGGDEVPFVHPLPPAAEVPISRELVRTLLAEQHPDLADREVADPIEGFDMAVFRLGYGGVDKATAARARGIGLVKAATLAVVDKQVVAGVGWRALVELGVARPGRSPTTRRRASGPAG